MNLNYANVNQLLIKVLIGWLIDLIFLLFCSLIKVFLRGNFHELDSDRILLLAGNGKDSWNSYLYIAY